MGLDWHAVIHADGNRFGQVFRNFQDHLPGGACGYENRDYVDRLRRFSAGLDGCTRDAFRAALDVLARRRQPTKATRFLPVVPIVLGGDDLTVVCDGAYAVQLARDFLQGFEARAETLWQVVGLGRPPGGPQRPSACAGVAVVKPHYPFYAAYELAERLLKSAKAVKEHAPDASALDYHILYDASGHELEAIRARLHADGDTRLYARPYVVSPKERLPAPADDWLRFRHVDDLEARVRAMRARDEDGRRRLPNGLLHELREGLFLGRGAANARLALARGRYGRALGELLPDGLYFPEGRTGVTPFLDALDLVDFWADENEEGR
jgi:hypothetical protein